MAAPRGWRAAGLAAGTLLAVAALACERPVGPAELGQRIDALERPNLVLVVVDTLRADATTPYAPALDTTPELAAWADRGIVFERTRSQSSWTKMSMASLMTSLWPHSHAIRAYGDGLGEGALTLAEVLQQAGYATYGVQTNGWLHQTFGFHQGFDRYVFPSSPKGEASRIPKSTVWAHADRVLEETVRILDALPGDRPFFLYLHFMDVHEYASPNEFKRDGTDARGNYRSAVRWVDDALSRVRKALETRGLLEDSVLVLASDHGEAFGENGRHGHARNVLTAVVSVPLVVRLPFAVEPVRVKSQVRNLDLAPTLLDLAGVAIPEGFEGESLVPLVLASARGESAADRESFAALGLPLYLDASVQTSLNTGHWTFARNVPPDPQPAEFLYDRSVDPGENVNLVELEPGEAAHLRARLDAHLARPPAPGVLQSDVRIDPGIAQKLRALGYAQ